MKLLILNPGRKSLKFELAGEGIRGVIDNYRGNENIKDILFEIQKRISSLKYPSEGVIKPDAIALRVIYGGEKFREPVVFSDKILKELKDLIPLFPLHMPGIIEIAQAYSEISPETPIVLIFETAFFAGMPSREFSYAVNPAIFNNRRIRKFGFHGLLHDAVSSYAVQLQKNKKSNEPAHIISICLEPRPEAAAILGFRPLTVTSGMTPLEGLFGDTTCGDIDPGIIIQISQSLHWGLEQINQTLTEESGIVSLAGTGKTLEDIFAKESRANKKARELFLYKLLQACGAGMSAIGAADYIIFSGRYKQTGNIIGPWLTERLIIKKLTGDNNKVEWSILPQTLEEVISENVIKYLTEYNKKQVLESD